MEVAMRQDVTLREEYLLKVWDNYIQEILVETTPCQAAIFDLRTKRLIICSTGFNIHDNELNHVIEGLKYPDVVYRNGISVRGRHYEVKLADGRHGIFAKDGLDGCTVCKTFSLLIIGVHDKRVAGEVCNEQIMKLGDYFLKLGL